MGLAVTSRFENPRLLTSQVGGRVHLDVVWIDESTGLPSGL